MKSIVLVLGLIIFRELISVLGTHETAREFSEMCKIYRLLITKPKGIQVYEGDQPLDPAIAARRIMDEIDFYNLSTTSEKLYALIKEKESKEDAPESMSEVREIDPQQWKKWHTRLNDKGIAEGLPAQAGSLNMRPSDPEVREKSHRLIGKIYIRADAILEKIIEQERLANQDLSEAQKHMVSAVFGEAAINAVWADKAKNSTYNWKDYVATGTSFPSTSESPGSGGWDTGCKRDGNSVGMSMVSDFCCICGLKTSDNTNQLCGVNLQAVASGAYDQESDGVDRWAELKKKCDQILDADGLGAPSPASLASAVALHRALLGVNWAGKNGFPTTEAHTDGKNFILGRFAVDSRGAVGCDGQKYGGNGQGVCVDYTGILKTGKEIPWVKQVRQAESLLENAAQKEHRLQLLLNSLQQEKRMAEITYEEAFLTIQTQPGSRNSSGAGTSRTPNPTTSADGATAQESAAVSAARTPRFILPWTLLI